MALLCSRDSVLRSGDYYHFEDDPEEEDRYNILMSNDGAGSGGGGTRAASAGGGGRGGRGSSTSSGHLSSKTTTRTASATSAPGQSSTAVSGGRVNSGRAGVGPRFIRFTETVGPSDRFPRPMIETVSSSKERLEFQQQHLSKALPNLDANVMPSLANYSDPYSIVGYVCFCFRVPSSILYSVCSVFHITNVPFSHFRRTDHLFHKNHADLRLYGHRRMNSSPEYLTHLRGLSMEGFNRMPYPIEAMRGTDLNTRRMNSIRTSPVGLIELAPIGTTLQTSELKQHYVSSATSSTSTNNNPTRTTTQTHRRILSASVAVASACPGKPPVVFPGAVPSMARGGSGQHFQPTNILQFAPSTGGVCTVKLLFNHFGDIVQRLTKYWLLLLSLTSIFTLIFLSRRVTLVNCVSRGK